MPLSCVYGTKITTVPIAVHEGSSLCSSSKHVLSVSMKRKCHPVLESVRNKITTHQIFSMQSPLGLKLKRVLLQLGSFFGHDMFAKQVWVSDTQVFCFLVHWPEFDQPFPSQFCLMHPGAMGALSLETRIVIWCETINTNVLVDKVQKIS